MLKIYSCIANAHDLRLVVLAALVCALASFAAINLLRHARGSSGQMRSIWLAVSAVSTGFGIWATHFIAMLAFTPGIPNGRPLADTLAHLERRMIVEALQRASGNQSRAARELGVTEQAIRYKIRKYRLRPR